VKSEDCEVQGECWWEIRRAGQVIATRRTTVHDGDAGDACLVTASANVFKDALFPVPLVASYNKWDLAPHTTPPSRQTLYRLLSAGYVMGPRRCDGIGFERQSGVFEREEVDEGKAGGAEAGARSTRPRGTRNPAVRPPHTHR
jgi:hypothetical protein